MCAVNPSASSAEKRRVSKSGHQRRPCACRADPDGDHIFCHLLAETDNTHIIVLRNDVGEAIVDNEFHLYLGVVQKQLAQGRPLLIATRVALPRQGLSSGDCR